MTLVHFIQESTADLTPIEKIQDAQLWFQINLFLGNLYGQQCRFEDAIKYFKRVIERFPGGGAAVSKSNLTFFVYLSQGKFGLGYQTTKEAVDIADISEDIWLKAYVYPMYGMICYELGFWEESFTYLLEGFSLSEKVKIGTTAGHSAKYMGEIYFQNGEYQKSLFYYQKSLDYFELVKATPTLALLSRAGIARAKVLMNERYIDLEILMREASESNTPFLHRWGSSLPLTLG